MLTAARRCGIAAVVAAGLVLATPRGPAEADVTCPPNQEWCTVTVEDPGQPGTSTPPGSGSGGSDARVCRVPRTGAVFPCYEPLWGWFSNADGCYYARLDPQPSADEAVWDGRFPEGAVYEVTCMDRVSPGTNGGWTWLPTPPEGFGATSVTPGELAAKAVDSMGLVGPAVNLSVAADELGTVGLPVWLWTSVTPTTWGPNSATASVPGLSVTANAQVVSITWSMGDGGSVTCGNPGTPYIRGEVHSPTCEYVFSTSSAGQPGDAYTITATSTWRVTWSGGGSSGSFTVTRSSSTTARIGELQVLVTT